MDVILVYGLVRNALLEDEIVEQDDEGKHKHVDDPDGGCLFQHVSSDAPESACLQNHHVYRLSRTLSPACGRTTEIPQCYKEYIF